MMNFKDQIKNPKWQKRRLEIMTHDNFTCQICGDTETTLNVHHLHYDSNRLYWEYDDSELITLCEDCHSNEHDYSDCIDKYIHQLKKKGITIHEIIAIMENILISVGIGDDKAILQITGPELVHANDIINLTNRRIDVKEIHRYRQI